MNEQHGCERVEQIIEPITTWVKALVEDMGTLDAAALERRVRGEGLEQLAGVFTALVQAKVDAADAPGRCGCGGRLHHGGRREREVMSSLGPVPLNGVYRRCRSCGHTTHAVDAVSKDWLSTPMQELVTLLGVSMASFAKASAVCGQVLGVKLSPQTVCRVTQAAGRALPPPPEASREVSLTPGGRVTGSCDGTSVNTREHGWRELKAYLFERGDKPARVRLADAALEPTGAFFPRVRQGAIAVRAANADQLFFVADAAAWIDQGLRVNLPTATRIIDIYHAYQHVHTAAKTMFGEGTDKATRWSVLWCEQLRLEGGPAVWDRLRRTRWRYPQGSPPRAGLDQLLGYLDRHAGHLDYPTYIRRGWPISSGPMESLCKQLGQRLKGCGMRWNQENVTPMARLLCRWHTNQPLNQAA